MFYAGLDEFVQGATAFISDGVSDGDPVLVVVDALKIEALRARLGRRADDVLFADMAEVGTNPGCIIPAWQDFLDEHTAPGRRLRGIGEPLTTERMPAEAVECHRHEALLNLAFTDVDFWLLCPYDTTTLSPLDVDAARRTHPLIRRGDTVRPSDVFSVDPSAGFLAGELSPPPPDAAVLVFHRSDLRTVRDLVTECARRAGISTDHAAELALAASEMATNSVRHAGGNGTILVWRDGDDVVCDVRDRGRIADPLAGRVRPSMDGVSGRGLWLANQLCDLVQLRSSDTGTTIRLQMRISTHDDADTRRG